MHACSTTIRFIIFLWMTMVVANTACAQVVIGQKSTEEINSKNIPVKSVPDWELQTKLNRVLAKIDDLKQINAKVEEGVVTLTGTVPRPSALRKAEQLVSRFEGVLYVNNRIRDDADLEERLGPVMTRLTKYTAAFINKLPVLGVVLTILLIFYGISRAAGVFVSKSKWFGDNRLTRNLASRMIRSMVILIGLFIALDILDVTALVGAVVGTAGILGLAIGFAFKDIVENYLAGIILSIRRPFAVNDSISVDKYEGSVIRLNSRELVLMTSEGNHVLIPNATVFKNVIVNFTRNSLRQFSFSIGVRLNEDLLFVRTVALDALLSVKGVASDPAPLVRVESLGEYAVTMRFAAWVNQKDYDFSAVRSQALRTVKEEFDTAEIKMPYPRNMTYLGELGEPTQQTEGRSFHLPLADGEDVSANTDLKEQVQEEINKSQEENLLDQSEK